MKALHTLAATALAGLALITLPACESKSAETTKAVPTEEALSAEELINNPNTANPQEIDVPNDLGVMTFAEKEYDFGTIHQGEVVTHVFEFTNTGKKPIIIDNASSTCGCTIPTYPREPVAPGEKGHIDVRFDSHAKVGQVIKIVTLRANTQPNINEVTIRANVLVP